MVEKIIVSINPNVVDYLDKLTFRLYEAEYFSYIENADQYVLDIYASIEPAINNKKHKQTPFALLSYGEF